MEWLRPALMCLSFKPAKRAKETLVVTTPSDESIQENVDWSNDCPRLWSRQDLSGKQNRQKSNVKHFSRETTFPHHSLLSWGRDGLQYTGGRRWHLGLMKSVPS